MACDRADVEQVSGDQEAPRALEPALRAELLDGLVAPDFDRADGIEPHSASLTRTFAALLSD